MAEKHQTFDDLTKMTALIPRKFLKYEVANFS